MALPNTRRPVPDDFATYAQDKTDALRARYHCSFETIRRWIAETGTVRDRKPAIPRATPAPEGFAIRARVDHVSELTRIYAVDTKVIRRWLREEGMEPAKWKPSLTNPKPKAVPKPREPRTPRERKLGATFSRMGRRTEPMVSRPVTGIFEEARDYLAGRLNCPGYRCDPNGAANQKGTHHRVGMAVYSPTDLLATAKARGMGKVAA